MRPASPYLVPGFYDRALAQGRHRQVTGGWWEETGRLQLALLQAEGMEPGDRLLDIGCGALRLGCKAVPFLNPGNYWGTDASGALMRRGWQVELPPADQARLPPAQLVQDADFALPGIPPVDFAIAFGVFTHLPAESLSRALATLAPRFGGLRAFLFTVFLPGSPGGGRPATHVDRPPYEFPPPQVAAIAASHGLRADCRPGRLPRGQTLFVIRGRE